MKILLLAALLIVLLASHANAISIKTNAQIKLGHTNRSNIFAATSSPHSAEVGGRKNLSTSENISQLKMLATQAEPPISWYERFGYSQEDATFLKTYVPNFVIHFESHGGGRSHPGGMKLLPRLLTQLYWDIDHRQPKLTKEEIAKLHSEVKAMFDYILATEDHRADEGKVEKVLSSDDFDYWWMQRVNVLNNFRSLPRDFLPNGRVRIIRKPTDHHYQKAYQEVRRFTNFTKWAQTPKDERLTAKSTQTNTNDFKILVNYGYSLGECARIRIFLHNLPSKEQNPKSKFKPPKSREQDLKDLQVQVRRNNSELYLHELRKYADEILEESRDPKYLQYRKDRKLHEFPEDKNGRPLREMRQAKVPQTPSNSPVRVTNIGPRNPIQADGAFQISAHTQNRAKPKAPIRSRYMDYINSQIPETQLNPN